ncbi:MAG: hypothetical protein CMN85_05750 [Spongiibacteraceae bacterium]|nr:hypothetical protein [Spongiibacteraceae bacterium]
MNVELSPASTPAITRQWEAQLDTLLEEHFSAVRERIPAFYEQHFGSLRRIASRHWQYRRDIPRDLATLPRFTWRALQRLGGRRINTERRYSAKELALASVISGELLHMPALEEKLLRHLSQHPELDLSRQREVQAILARYSPADLEQRLQDAVARLAVDHEGSRDVIVFLALGMLGRAVSDKIAFGSAGVLGATAAGSLYISQQSFFAGLWAKWVGVPGWVSVAGGSLGIVSLLLLTPVLAPLVEFGVNRFRAERMLGNLVDQVQQQLQHPGSDGYTLAAYTGTYIQLLPDLLNILRSLR